MEIFKIPYIFSTKTQLKIPIVEQHNLICSKDGFLYFCYNSILLNRYLINAEKNKLPSYNHYDAQLLKYNQLYFAVYRAMDPYSVYKLNFYYCIKTKSHKNLFVKYELSDFKKTEKFSKHFTRQSLEDFLFNTDNIYGKYIIDATNNLVYSLNKGIIYAKSNSEDICINHNFDFSDEAIIKQFNELNNNDKNNAQSIDEVDEFTLSYDLQILTKSTSKFIMIEIAKDYIYAYNFTITFCHKNNFKVDIIRTSIIPDVDEILSNTDETPISKVLYRFYRNDPVYSIKRDHI